MMARAVAWASLAAKCAEAHDIVKAKFSKKTEQLGVAEASVSQDRRPHIVRQRLFEPDEAHVFDAVSFSLQFGLEDGKPQQWRRPAVTGDKTEHQRRLIVSVEIGPVHGDHEFAALARQLLDP